MDELKPCPFCAYPHVEPRPTYNVVVCPNCACAVPLVQWNRRAPAGVPREPTEAFNEACRDLRETTYRYIDGQADSPWGAVKASLISWCETWDAAQEAK